jgi:hypothetical protein
VSRTVARAIAAKIDVEILLNAEQASAFLQINPSGSRWQISGRTRPPKIKKVDVRGALGIARQTDGAQVSSSLSFMACGVALSLAGLVGVTQVRTCRGCGHYRLIAKDVLAERAK